MLVVFGGLPGVGKTRLARAVAGRLRGTYLRVDAVEAAMWASGVERSQPTGLAAYGVLEAVAEANLRLGATVLVDAVNPVEAARVGWRELAGRVGVALRVVEVICSDPDEHRRRVEERVPDLTYGHTPSWGQVRAREYEPWHEPRLTVDTVLATEELITRILAYVATPSR